MKLSEHAVMQIPFLAPNKIERPGKRMYVRRKKTQKKYNGSITSMSTPHSHLHLDLADEFGG